MTRRSIAASLWAALTLFVSVGPIRADGPALDRHDGYEGRWVRTPHAQAFIAVRPRFRVLALSRPGEPSLMADAAHPEYGVRLAYMEPTQIDDSFDPGNQPGRFIESTPSSATVQLAASAAAELRYTVHVALDERLPRLRLRYRLENLSDRPRRYAAWSLTSFEPNGRIVALFGAEARPLRRIALPWWTRMPQPGYAFGRRTLAVDCGRPLNGTACKIGLASDTGWVAMVRHGRALVSAAAYDPHAAYPEGGANITIFQMDKPDRRWCEMEQVSPLTDADPGAAVELTETLTLIDLANTPAEPDALGEAIEAAMITP